MVAMVFWREGSEEEGVGEREGGKIEGEREREGEISELVCPYSHWFACG